MYDFLNLSSYDFELLVRDLLSAELGTHLEAFKPGPDQGIDLRGKRGGKTLTVQCKHYARSGVKALIRDLRTKELPRLERLQPEDYYFVTSVPLSPANKDTIREVLTPFIASTESIFGNDDLNALLRDHPEVERSNFKLWLTSSTVLESIVHAEQYVQNEIEMERISRRARIYVQNASYFKAKEILEDAHYCLISGIPGIGKTTLAEMLALEYMQSGYQLVRVTGNIKEAHRLFKREERQLFLYDDFLGATSLEFKFGKNEESDLIRFIETLRRSHGRLLLTTREYILHQAQEVYERLAQAQLHLHQHVVRLGDYTRVHRAQILFNHLYFSELPDTFKKNILEGAKYKHVITHPNFNPRIIEWMTELDRVTNESSATSYAADFLKKLTNPKELWRHAFTSQISADAQLAVIALASLPRPAPVDALEIAFLSLRERSGARQPGRGFPAALKEVEGTFLLTTMERSTAQVDFHNPSAADFAEGQMVEPRRLSEVIEAAAFFEQLVTLVELARSRPDASQVLKLAETERRQLFERMVSLAHAEQEKLDHTVYSWHRWNAAPRSTAARVAFLLNWSGEELAGSMPDRIRSLIQEVTTSPDRLGSAGEIIELLKSAKRINGTLGADVYNRLIESVEDVFSSVDRDLSAYVHAVEYYEEFGKGLPEEDRELFAVRFQDFVSNEVSSWVGEEDDFERLLEFADQVEEVGNFVGVALRAEADSLRERAEELESQPWQDEEVDYRPIPGARDASEGTIEMMFALLLDR